ncbi:hypothetical protein [Cellulophaga sp. L1A9]|uniref:hypothetical protein n=1 Tax=Cellulophaga sp. L1A9 TaxID=2686362 RepID=UPI00131A8362|nr:hypothetical protein [Cellulophaga sp. L1A9]
MEEQRKQWLNAVEEFRNDSNTVIKCPNCKKGILFFTDIAFEENDKNKGGKRIIECGNCGKFEIVLYRQPPENWYQNNNL